MIEGHDVENLFVCHRCDNPPCVRPEHLFVGTASDNVQDMLTKGRSRSPLSLDEIRALQLNVLPGTTAEIAEALGSSPAAISRARTGAAFAKLKSRAIDEEFESLCRNGSSE